MKLILSSLVACLCFGACVTEALDARGKMLKNTDPKPVELLDPAALQEEPDNFIGPMPVGEAHTQRPTRAGERVLLRSDGRTSKFFSIRAGRGDQFKALIVKYCEIADAAIELISKGDVEALKDPRGPAAAPAAAVDISDWLVVTGNEAELMRVENFINLYYASIPQIEIEAKIAEVTTDNVKDFGAITDVFNGVQAKIVEDIDPSAPGTQDPSPNFHAPINQSHTSFPNSSTTSTANFLLRAILGKTELKSTLQLLVSNRNVDIVSSPRIAVRNGGKAEIINGEEIPYVNITNFAPGQSTFSGSVQFKQTGVKLYVVPYLAGTDTIHLNVEAEVSIASGFSEVGGVSNPIIVTRNAKTDVHLRDGSTFVIGGLISSNDSQFVKKVPLLGDIPILGLLFRSTYTQKIYTEIIFFITPKVIYREEGGNELILP